MWAALVILVGWPHACTVVVGSALWSVKEQSRGSELMLIIRLWLHLQLLSHHAVLNFDHSHFACPRFKVMKYSEMSLYALIKCSPEMFEHESLSFSWNFSHQILLIQRRVWWACALVYRHTPDSTVQEDPFPLAGRFFHHPYRVLSITENAGHVCAIFSPNYVDLFAPPSPSSRRGPNSWAHFRATALRNSYFISLYSTQADHHHQGRCYI